MGSVNSRSSLKKIDLLKTNITTNHTILKILHERLLLEFHYKLKNDLI